MDGGGEDGDVESSMKRRRVSFRLGEKDGGGRMDGSVMPSRKPNLPSRSAPHHSHSVPQTTSTTAISTRAATSPPSKVKCTLGDLRKIYPNETVLGNQRNYAELFQRPNGIPVTKEHLLDDPIPKDV